DNTWSILSNARQLLPDIDSHNIKSENVSISHLRSYLTVVAEREDDITIVRAFILFMMRYLWFQTANDTVPLGYLVVVNNLDSAAQYDWGSAILASLYHVLDTAVTTGGAITEFVQLLPYWFYEYCGVGHPIVKEEVTGEVRIPLDPLLNMSLHISPVAFHEMRQASLLGEAKGPDLGWHMEWTGGRERLPIARLRDLPPMSSSYSAEELWNLTHGIRRLVLVEYARDAQRLQEVKDELAITRRQIVSIDHQLYVHVLQLRRGRDIRVVSLPPGGGTRTRQRGSGP
ncbi:hypothetical protein GIB67_022840, partial [Kingdonia uniflora]